MSSFELLAKLWVGAVVVAGAERALTAGESTRRMQGGVEWSGVEWSGVEWDGMEWSGWLSFRAFFLAGWPARTDTGEMEELSGKQGTASMLSRLQVK